jgi:Glycogen recognition site of AMP-activated protein kinase
MNRPDEPIPGLASLREVTPPPSLEQAVMRRIAEPAPETMWSWLRKPRPQHDQPLAGLASLREVTPPPSLEQAVMRKIAEPAPETFWSWLRKPRPHHEQPIADLASLREVTPPPSLVPSVMRKIAEPAPETFWSWLRKPRRFELRLSPLSLAGLVAGVSMAMLVVWGSGGRKRDSIVLQVPEPTSSAPVTVVVRFKLVAQGARQVAVAGDFNDWDTNSTLLVNQDGQGNFVGTVSLPPGAHEYMFVVDGKWITDPAASELRPDGFGRTNAILRL